MKTINNLSSSDSLSLGDLLAFWSSNNGDTRKVSMNTLVEFIQAQGGDADISTTSTITGLKDIDPNTSTSNYIVLGGTILGDGLGGIYHYDSTSTLTEDDFLVVKSDVIGVSGRWLRMDLNNILVVETVTAMDNLEVNALGSTKTVFVKENGRLYTYDTSWLSKSVITIKTVDDLVNYSGIDGDIIIVSDLDRGGNFKWVATGTHDGGVVFSGSVGYWKRQYDDAVSVKWFGAVGDGITDDTVAIQNAIDTSRAIIIPNGIFKLMNGLSATHEVQIRCYGTLKYEGTNAGGIVLDITTSTDDLDFEKAPTLEGLNIIGNENAYCGIRINSVLAPRIINYTSKGFTDGWALVFRNIALVAGARWCEAYYIENIQSNYNKGGIRFHVDGGTTSFGYGHISGNITNKIGSVSNQSIGMLVETTQLYQSKIDLNIWCNGYGTAVKVGSSSYPNARIYWCDLRLGGEGFNTDNYSIDLTNGQIFGCTGVATLNQGRVLNPSNNRLEIYGQYQRTNYGNTTKQINGYDTKLTPLAASFQVEDAFSGKPEGGFGISTGSNMTCPIIWMRDYVGNSFRVTKAVFDDEPDTADYLLDVYYDGQVKAKTKFKAPMFASYETTFYAAASTTTTQVFDIASLIDTKGTYLITCNGYGTNTNLSVTGLSSYSGGSGDIITPVVTLATQDFNYGSIALQTYNNIAANTYNAGNGRKFQVVVTNANATQMLMNLTITRIG